MLANFKIRAKFSYTILLMFNITLCSSYLEDLEIKTSVGSIKGLRATDGNYYMFLGIPYATVDANNPFGPAMVRSAIQGTLNAYDGSSMCPQINLINDTVMGTLDCLRLNIYVPKKINTEIPSTPVMIWIYGGSFQYGYGGTEIYGPKYLVKHDVIVVTFNYRTGPYGFMCLDIAEVPGNQGLKDQYLAIQWVKENIEAFGGDSYQITVFGSGAGAHSIDLHLMSSKEVLFNRVILQSGSAQATTILHEPDKSAPLKMARYIGFETSNIKHAVYFLSRTDKRLVISAANNLNIQFKPCVEKIFKNNDSFISYPWINLKVPQVNNIPVMMGFAKHELAKFFIPEPAERFSNSTIIYDCLKQLFNFSEHELVEVTNLVSRFYVGGEQISENIKWKYINFSSDFTYVHPIYRTLYKYVENRAGRIYFYMFSYVGERNALKITMNNGNESTNCCASHGDELGYIFKMQGQPELTGADNLVMQQISYMWTNFAKYSDPTPVNWNLIPVKWEPFEPKTHYYLNIDRKLKLEMYPMHDRVAFWDLFFRKIRNIRKDIQNLQIITVK